MSKFVWGEDLNGQTIVLDGVILRDGVDGVNSVIRGYLSEQKYVLADMKAKATEALLHEANRIQFEGEAGAKKTERDNLFLPWMKIIKLAIQFLKKKYKNNIRELQSWTVTVGVNGKIYYPAEFLKLVVIAEGVIAKHESYTTPANPSPLALFIKENNVDVAKMKIDISNAKVADKEFHDKQNAAVEETAKRNAAWNPEFSKLKDIGDFIASLYPLEPYKPREWGYQMSDAPAGTKSRVTKMGRGETKKGANILVGGIFENTGGTVLLVVKDTKKKDAGKVLQPGDKLLMGKGYSKIKVTNQDLLNEGEFTVDVHD